MIGENVIRGERDYHCDRCKNITGWFSSHKAAISAGWAISRGYKKCYCPTCAPLHRNTGRGGAPAVLPPGFQQMKLNLNGE